MKYKGAEIIRKRVEAIGTRFGLSSSLHCQANDKFLPMKAIPSVKRFLSWIGLHRRTISVYRIAEGEEESRIRREILRGIQRRCKHAALNGRVGSGSDSLGQAGTMGSLIKQ